MAIFKFDNNNFEKVEVLNIGDKTYVISNQWDKDNIYKFLEYAKNLGYEIEEDKQCL